ncbi:MAG TPA: phosphatase PAP2 family protein [Gemmatimonadaceae bacterium]
MNPRTPEPLPEHDRRLGTRGPTRAFWDALFQLLRGIAGQAHSLYAAVGIFLLVGSVLALGGVWAFVALADRVDDGATQAFDTAVLQWVAQLHFPRWMEPVTLEITMLGTGTVVFMIVSVAALFLVLTKHRHSALLLVIATAGSVILNNILKASFHRPRPQVFQWGTHAFSSSFPSGHAMSAATVYLTIAYLAARLHGSAPVRWTIWLVAFLVIVLIATSRVILGVHYPSDVAAGLVLGAAWAGFCWAMLEALQLWVRRRAPASVEVAPGSPVQPTGDRSPG